MTQDELQTQFQRVCVTFFPHWDNNGWRAIFDDIGQLDGLVERETKVIKIAKRLNGKKTILVVIHEVAHAATGVDGHSAQWSSAITKASQIAAGIGHPKLAKQLQREARHKSITDSDEDFYEWVNSLVQEHPDITFDFFWEKTSQAFHRSKEDILAAFPLVKRRFSDAKARMKSKRGRSQSL